MDVQVVVTYGALVMGSDPSFLASVTFEWDLGVVISEPVFRVAEMRNFVVFHGYVQVNEKCISKENK